MRTAGTLFMFLATSVVLTSAIWGRNSNPDERVRQTMPRQVVYSVSGRHLDQPPPPAPFGGNVIPKKPGTMSKVWKVAKHPLRIVAVLGGAKAIHSIYVNARSKSKREPTTVIPHEEFEYSFLPDNDEASATTAKVNDEINAQAVPPSEAPPATK